VSFVLESCSLYQDLMSEARDPMYRAMSYIARQGGPKILGPADELANLKAHRAAMAAWLQAQEDVQRLAEDYAQYRVRWSPVFRD